MKKINLGVNKNDERIDFDFDEEGINFTLLYGCTGTGKSIFHCNLYKELSQKYTPNEIGFLFLDMTRVDLYNWSSDYLIKPVIVDRKEAINALHDLAEIKTDKKIFVHIEECDMVFFDRERVESAFKKLRNLTNIYITYSTSRLDRDYLSLWIKNFIDLKVVFATATEDDSVFLLGNDMAYKFKNPGERILAFNNKQIFCQPFSDEEAKTLNEFKL